ncbi:MAG: hypothetical protein CSA36_05915 [Draconibacterium sp.]|nr:MAG: hypothetical protein CSA36_05915 [Draconibacterium sp.]
MQKNYCVIKSNNFIVVKKNRTLWLISTYIAGLYYLLQSGLQSQNHQKNGLKALIDKGIINKVIKQTECNFGKHSCF